MKTALITGAARRVGAGLALELAAMGYAVAIHHRSDAEAAKALAAAIVAAGGRAVALQADLSTPQACGALMDAAARALGPVDTLVNNASHFAHDTVQTMTPATWADAIAANLTAPMFLIQALARQLPADASGVVVNILDQKVGRPNPDHFSYTAGKVGLAQMIPALALALAPHIRVCGISPGITLPSGPQSDEDYRRAVAATPLGVSSSVEALRRALRFVLESDAFTGQILTLDGGESLLGRPRDVAYDESV
ncbi:SDR family oxidoreductase [Phenylobacterium sp.]|uniref:SDR family oxidoreductase n=1 Tax=Phenylobacterium sp. TaxID=1871053 RepID=UPI0025E1EEED|nr:SDR family oxidoreductase [Phenylobacterium sp.]